MTFLDPGRSARATVSPGRVVALVGPTAVGKSALAMELAGRFPVAIVSADSRQVYRYMDIGTAKPSAADRAAVQHFMLDLVEPDAQYSMQRYVAEGRRVLQALWDSGCLPLVVGGTGFYLRGLLDGLSLPAVPPNPTLRRELYAEIERFGPETLHARLGEQDPVAAGRIHPRNLPRLVRALEINAVLGGPVPTGKPEDRIPALFLGLDTDRPALRRRADERIAQQISAGLVEEVRRLLVMGYREDLPSLQGFGYREMLGHLAGRYSLAEAVDGYRRATYRYIRRQRTWFRADPRILWLDVQEDPLPRAVERVEAWLSAD